MTNCKRCGHSFNVHQHWRGGTDCGNCECRSYRRIYWQRWENRKGLKSTKGF